MQLVVLFGDPAQGCQVAKPLQNNYFSIDFLLSGESVDGMAAHSGLLESINTDQYFFFMGTLIVDTK